MIMVDNHYWVRIQLMAALGKEKGWGQTASRKKTIQKQKPELKNGCSVSSPDAGKSSKPTAS